ncbi:flagellin [Lawsonibacter sp. LCP25S3_G6]|uniref:flagellin n=1 Tax=unclassified Lawsonibacter TaxID=2617946 RepID=UPI003F981916
MLRVTTNSTLYTYQKNLLKSSNQLYQAMNAMTTGRKFDSYSADPAAATRAFQIHSSLNATNTQAANNKTVYNKFSTAWDMADDMINELTSDLAKTPLLEGLNQPNWSTLNTQGDVILSGAEAMVQNLNAKYDGNYIFNGADTKNPPFAIETVGDKHYLTYRNVRVDDDPNSDYYTKEIYHDANGNTIKNADGSDMTNGQALALFSSGSEHQYVDIGIGFEVKDGNVISSTAFDAAISGLEFIGGAGLDENGDPKNIISIMLRAAEVFKGYDQEGSGNGSWGSAGDLEDAKRLVDKFTTAQDALSNQHVQLETDAKYLQTNQSQLESTFYSLNTELNSIEKIDQVEAILNLVSMQTSYNAAIQVGANIVPQSLMDYLK